jgi:monooxygenase
MDFAGVDRFRGQIVHPQHWPEKLDYAGERVIVIGSGATAITLVPAMTDKAAHVTMLQRSPTYVVSLTANDRSPSVCCACCPGSTAYAIARWKNVAMSRIFYQACRRRPEFGKKTIRKGATSALPPGYPVDVHFKPRYQPWDQRLCVVPDSDLFKAIAKGIASIVTDRIETFAEKSIKLVSGAELEADLIVTPTGLKMMPLGGAHSRRRAFTVDGRAVDVSKCLSYKGMMLSGVPTRLRSPISTPRGRSRPTSPRCTYVACLTIWSAADIANAFRDAQPTRWASGLDLSSGYVKRSIDEFPRKGSRKPWRLYQNYLLDLLTLKYGAVDDAAMEFSKPAPRVVEQPSLSRAA